MTLHGWGNSLSFVTLCVAGEIKAWNGQRPKEGYGSQQASTNEFEIDWVKAWERVPSNK